MHNYFDPVVIYGWEEKVRECAIDSDWIAEHKISSYALDVVRGYGGNLAYGLPCSFFSKSGTAKVSAKDKKLVKAAHAASKSDKPLRYLVVLCGDYEVCHEIYRPDEEKEEEEPVVEEPMKKKQKKAN